MNLIYLNGEFLPPNGANISVFDRGFIFGDGIYEVIPVFGGRLFRLPHHFERLETSLAAIGIKNPHTHDEWKRVFTHLIEDNGGGEMSVYLQVTRGAAPRDHPFPVGVTPTFFAYAKPVRYPEPETVSTGVTAITAEDIRWCRCDIKAIALLPNVMLRQLAQENGAAEAVLIRDGQVTEGAASNIFAVKNSRLLTPPKGPYILPGITRDLVLELARKHGIPVTESAISESDLLAADEIWMTNSTREILPIIRINDKSIGKGAPGPMHKKLHALYQEYKRAFRAGHTD